MHDLDKALLGARPGDQREAEAHIGSSSPDPALRNQHVRVTFEILDLKTLRMPEITPAFLQTVGFDSQDELRGRVESARVAFVNQATQLGLTKEQAEALADQYGLIPDRVDTIITGDASAARQEGESAKDYLNRLRATIDRVRRLHDALDAETDLTSPNDEITRGRAARKIAAALDGWTDPAELRRLAAETQQQEPGPGADLIEDYLKFLRDQGPEPDLSDLPAEQRDAIAGQFRIVRALFDRDPNLPSLDCDPVARRLGLHRDPAAEARQQPDTETRVVAYRSPGTRTLYCLTCARQETGWQAVTDAPEQVVCDFCGGRVHAVAAQTLGEVVARYLPSHAPAVPVQPAAADDDEEPRP